MSPAAGAAHPGQGVIRAARSGLIAMVLALGACASTSLTEVLSRGAVKGDAERVSVAASSAGEGLPLAVAHCARFRRSAQFAARETPGRYRYRCVAAD